MVLSKRPVALALALSYVVVTFLGILVSGSLGATIDNSTVRRDVDVPIEVRELSGEEFRFVERKRIYGFYSYESCLYRSENYIVIKHYCFPTGQKRARSLQVVSAQLGSVVFYQEQLSKEKRELRIEIFAEDLKAIAGTRFLKWSLSEWDAFYRKLSARLLPACWTTNFDQASAQARADCYQEEIASFPLFNNSGLNLVNSKTHWDETYIAIEKMLTDRYSQTRSITTE